MSVVLVTGGSGFIAGYTLLRLLEQGHQVRATVRDLTRVPEVRAILRTAGNTADERLSFVPAELGHDRGWSAATEGCEFVLHMASPFPAAMPNDENEVIGPAVDGTLRVLKAAREAAVKRVVLTSSFAAIGYGHESRRQAYDESVWTQLRPETNAYVKSKTLAERAAWNFVRQAGAGLELAVINPVGVLGPLMSPDYSSSISLLKSMLDGAIPACPQLYFGLVDVRDVADLHVTAMTHPGAGGERFLAVAGDAVPLIEVARALKRNMGAWADRVPKRTLPNWLVRLAAHWNPAARQTLPELGKIKHLSNAKAQRLLDWRPRSAEEAIVATAQSLVRLGLLKSAPAARSAPPR